VAAAESDALAAEIEAGAAESLDEATAEGETEDVTEAGQRPAPG
jgi:hypothetical protein